MEACGGVGRLARHREQEVERLLGELVEGAAPQLAEHARLGDRRGGARHRRRARLGGKAPEKPAPTKPIEERSFMRATTSRNLADAPASANSTPAPGRAGAPAPAASPAPARPQAPPPAAQSPKTAQVA